MPLLPPSEFVPVFEHFQGKRIGFAQLYGNVGDMLIRQGARELLTHFGISYRGLMDEEIASGELRSDVDEILISGGGNMGTALYGECRELRRRIRALGKPVSILPQTFTDGLEDTSPYRLVFVRDRASARIDPRYILAPDLALGIQGTFTELVPRAAAGVFLRQDIERRLPRAGERLPDPAAVCGDPWEYIALASLFEHVYTDRLHFAIAALMAGRRATLLPNSYYKNRSLYETWLRDLGCGWRDSLDGLDIDDEEALSTCWRWLAASPASLPRWSMRPLPPEGTAWREVDGQHVLHGHDGGTLAECNQIARLVWSQCDGEHRVEEVAQLFMDAYPDERLRVAGEIAYSVQHFIESGALLGDARPNASRLAGKRASALEIDVNAPVLVNDWLYVSARVSRPWHPDGELWFAVPQERQELLTGRGDPFLIAMLVEAMKLDVPIRLSGAEVSADLLNNLYSFQETWSRWRRELRHVKIEASTTDEPASGIGAVATFSGGLDSCYTLLRNCPERENGGGLNVRAALMIHGFDIPLSERTGFRRAFERGRVICEAVGVELIPLRTNFRQLNAQWEIRHGSALGASLSALHNRFDTGVISATIPEPLPSDWGSNPETDSLMGSRAMRIVHFGEYATRLDKFKAVAQWPEALRHLRVCWQSWDFGRNCGRCRKCLLTQLTLRCIGAPLDCFEEEPGDEDLAARIPDKYAGNLDRFDLVQLAEECRAREIDSPWSRRLAALYGKTSENTGT